MKVVRTALSDDLKRTIATNLAIAAARREWGEGRERFSFRVRWQIVRRRGRFTWAEWREDLRYLFRG